MVAPSGGPEGARAGATDALSAAGDGSWPRCGPEDRSDIVVDQDDVTAGALSSPAAIDAR